MCLIASEMTDEELEALKGFCAFLKERYGLSKPSQEQKTEEN
jgi:hypothetical protein